MKKLLTKNFVAAVAVLLLLSNAVTIAWWKPWQDSGTTRKITVTGESTIKSEPDEYQFYPYYERSTTAELTQLSKDLVAKLKELGVPSGGIKTNASNYDIPDVRPGSEVPPVNGDGINQTLNITLTVNNKDLAQKVQDYLLTTSPKGQITPSPVFSTAKQKSLQARARSLAVSDAKAKAGQAAGELDAKVGKVIEIKDSPNSGNFPFAVNTKSGASDAATSSTSAQTLPIQPGENELNYSVEVVFSLR